ncbi:hypothetical protein SLS53_005093 [Cytospora paraplurivora]|uniref:GDP/GTP exchange factor Sec2 N-terminal domain-containing protein n=1 Tax=Cytospora paraplurivora TaxID=2898453 RepID=A0AAN9U641_9PEZI
MNALPQPRLTTVPCCPNCGNDISLNLLPDLTPPDDTKTALAAAQTQIEDLQAQVRLLNQKATAAVDRWADYEDELARLRSELNQQKTVAEQQRNNSVATAATSTTTTRPQTPVVKEPPSSPAKSYTGSPSGPRASFAAAASSRISALLSRKSAQNLKSNNNNNNNNTPPPPQPPQPQQPGHQSSQSTSSLLPVYASAPGGGHQSSYSTSSLLPAARTTTTTSTSSSPLTLSLSTGKVTYTPGHSPAPSSDDLIEALSREQQLRVAAEGKLTDGSREIEELSITLFEQANEMVATERRARARLEERVGELERREEEKKRRLERLDQAMARIERARAVLGDGDVREKRISA